MDDVRLGEMLSTKLCHDLTGPIGAIANGVEFLAEEDEDMHAQALELIKQSSAEAINRLQFYRAAFGRINGGGEASLSDLKQQIQKFLSGGKVSLDWADANTDASGYPLSRRAARVVMNMVILAAGTLIRGGTLQMKLGEENGMRLVQLSVHSPHIKWEPMLGQALRHDMTVAEVDAKTVQAYVTGSFVKELGGMLEFAQDAERFTLVLRVPPLA